MLFCLKSDMEQRYGIPSSPLPNAPSSLTPCRRKRKSKRRKSHYSNL